MVDRYAGRCSFRGGAVDARRDNNINNNGCGCAGNRSECRKLEKKLKEIDFAIIDTVLYLDAYPDCGKALAYYHKLKCEREAVVEAINRTCGTPLTNFDNVSTDTWKWTDGPWPWEADAN